MDQNGPTRESSPDSDLLILGGGVSGLAAAYLAAKAGSKVIVLEGEGQAGGLLGTFPIGGTRLEYYYHHFFSHDAELKWLCDELGLGGQLRFHPSTMGIFRDGRHHPFNGALDLLRFSPLGWSDKARFAASSLYLGKLANWRKGDEIAAMDWFYRYAGRATTEAIWRPMLEIKFGPYARQVPLAWITGRLHQRLGSRKNGDEMLGYLDGSLDTLLSALLLALRRLGVSIITRARVEELLVEQGRVRGARTTQGEFSAAQVLSTLPSPHLVPLIAPHCRHYADQLSAIRYFGAVCTILEISQPLSATYWLNIADPGFPFGGVIEHTNLIRPECYQGRHIAYLSRYFEADHPLASMPKEEIARMMTEPLAKIYPDWNPKNLEQVHVFRTLTAATVCDCGFSHKVPPVRSPLAGFFASSMAHVYPDERSCNNAIRVAAEACRAMGLLQTDLPRGGSMAGLIGF